MSLFPVSMALVYNEKVWQVLYVCPEASAFFQELLFHRQAEEGSYNVNEKVGQELRWTCVSWSLTFLQELLLHRQAEEGGYNKKVWCELRWTCMSWNLTFLQELLLHRQAEEGGQLLFETPLVQEA